MKSVDHRVLLYGLYVGILLTSCAAPRVISNSAKVTPKGNFVAGYHTSINFATQTAGYLKDLVADNVETISKNDSISFDQNLININKAAVSYLIDPTGSGNEFYLKYGVYKGFDVGARWAGNAGIIEAQYQFVGPTGNIDDITKQRIYGSIGLQYSAQSQSLPSVLSYLQNRLGYSFNRKDILVPLLFSYSFGNEEKYGSICWGVAAGYSVINYSTVPIQIYNIDNTLLVPQNHRQQYMSYGFFMNVKAGFKYVYVIPSLSLFYQNYGSYRLLDGSSAVLKGLSIIPGIGLRFRIGRNSYNKKTTSK